MSLYLERQRIGATVYGARLLPAADIARMPKEFQLAAVTGYLIVLRESEMGTRATPQEAHSPRFRRLRDAIVAKNYHFLESPSDLDVGYLAPGAFWGTPIAIATFLDGAAADRLYEDLENWEANQDHIEAEITSNNGIRQHVSDLAATLVQRQAEEATVQAMVDRLHKDITTLDDQITALEGSMTPSFLATQGLKAVFAVLQRPIPKLHRSYTASQDFYLPVIRERLTSIANRPYDGPQVSTKYTTPELAAALDALTGSEAEELQALGISGVTLASAARSPMQQAGLQATSPVAVGMFSSGHVFGVAFDLSVAGQGVNLSNPKTRAAVNRILARHGLVLPEGLTQSDPNHGFLTKFLSDRGWAVNHMLGMMRGYSGALNKEKTKQAALKNALSKESLSLDGQSAALDAQIAAAQNRIAALQSEQATLEAQRAAKQNALTNKRNEVAARNAAKEKEPQRGREWWGEGREHRRDKDDYWERWTHEEFHEPGHDWSRDTYENSRGERHWEESDVYHGTEMRSTDNDFGMHESLLP